MALERNENISKRENKVAEAGGVPTFARKLIDPRSKPVAESLSDLLREIGVSRVDETLSVTNMTVSSPGGASVASPNSRNSPKQLHSGDHIVKHSSNTQRNGGEPNLFTGTVIAPSSDKPENMHASSLNHSRQAMMLRMEHLFDEVETRVLHATPTDSEVLKMLTAPKEEVMETKVRLPSKPVVIGDALPVPAQCPNSVEQLLEASLAHHNLGSFEDSLKFLEAARIQLADIEHRSSEHQQQKQQQQQPPHSPRANSEDAEVPERQLIYFDLDMYITLCKGNVYQSCGDDEQSLLHYMDAWAQATNAKDQDWEIISLNSIGMLAYYNLRYDVSLLCFHAVVNYRAAVITIYNISYNRNSFFHTCFVMFCCFSEQAYGEDSADTATAFNNEACCLYCLDKRGEARVRFEKAWGNMSRILGHRAPRAVTAWKNLEKARRAHAPITSKKDLQDSLHMRPDADRLLFGGTFTIQALPPIDDKKKKKKGGGGGKKKKKK